MSQKSKKFSNIPYIFLAVCLFFASISILSYYQHQQVPRITEKEFVKFLRAGKVAKVVLVQSRGEVHIILKNKSKSSIFSSLLGESPDYILRIPNSIIFDRHYREISNKLPPSQVKEYSLEEGPGILSGILSLLMNPLVLLLLLMLLMRYLGGSSGLGGAGGIWGITKSRAKFWNKESNTKITFKDVIGMRESKQELQEIVDFFKNPKRFLELGVRPPKGALLIGPPGTGKTLLARAVAGEADINFMSTTGSDFSDMFVGVGSNRVRDLFDTAAENAPCIVFIDEIDAVGRARNKGGGRAMNEEADNTLNQLLTKMDGFTPEANIFIIAATNLVDVLDPALLRPGRFDRQISTENPSMQERIDTFVYYCKKLPKLAKDVNPSSLADQTAGFSYAAIANVCNEAAFIAARKRKKLKLVNMEDFEDAIDREIGGIAKPSRIISSKEKHIVAIHEAGHALVSWFLNNVSPLVKITTVPRGINALGFAQYKKQEKFIYQEEQFHSELAVLMGGRVAEMLIFGSLSTGASDDLQRATKMALESIIRYGMSQRIGHISYPREQEGYNFTKPYSPALAELIDQEVKRILDEAYSQAKNMLTPRIDILKNIAEKLIEKEILFAKDIEKIVGVPPVARKDAMSNSIKYFSREK